MEALYDIFPNKTLYGHSGILQHIHEYDPVRIGRSHNIKGFLGVGISVFILKAGIEVMREAISELIESVETDLFNREEKEIASSVIGEIVMRKLQELDAVAYVRFASVYREFKDVNTFMEELKKMLDK